ncbi:MAG: archaeal proteasome endopeptidase complex subunit alpha [Candidatus Nanoarchaeia archaeon]|jgi:proteasome alpha subunit|nr:archaeal proteasome endopeptidase complex subunit alpha [Candidatus Nanoarchaeia archaeon]
MQQMQHQMMGYDRAITMFSPDGRLLQVEYAKKTVRLGNTAMGFVCKDGVLLVTDKRIADKLVVSEAVEKIFQIDEHIIATAAGIISDARVLIERAQSKAQDNQIKFDSPVDTLTIVKDICSLKQLCTQSGGLRPFGVSLLVAGVAEDGMRLYQTDPTGLYYQYRASVIGEAETEIGELLHKEYKENMKIEDALKLAIKGLKQFLGEAFSIDRLDAAYIGEDRKMKKLNKEELTKYIK